RGKKPHAVHQRQIRHPVLLISRSDDSVSAAAARVKRWIASNGLPPEFDITCQESPAANSALAFVFA
ncbi:MAG TPA: hypothetical protein VKT50_08035, partial [Candidatus Acidoferrales bacterium]|nr:hypothetical protein [Candidatus Acidoferrales bacterium]